MKALELLRRELQNNYEKRPFIINRELYHKERIEDFHEAIDELQDLQSRSCDNCLHEKSCDIVVADNKKFYCSDWESK